MEGFVFDDCMKKLFSIILTFTIGASFAQALVSTVPLDLKKPSDRRQIFASQMPDGTFYCFASDKEKVVCLKYNSALFFRDSISVKLPDADAVMAGSGFDGSGTPYLYWSSRDNSRIFTTSFNFTDRSSFKNSYTFSYETQTFLGMFDNGGAFHILTIDDEKPILTLRTFKDGSPHENQIDLLKFEVADRRGKKLKWIEALTQFGLQIIQDGDFIPLVQSSSQIKMYLRDDNFCIALDIDPTFTQLLSVSTKTFEVTETKVPQLALHETGVSKGNSFLIDSTLWQIRANDKELVIGANLLKPITQTVHSYSAGANDKIDFRNSPLLVQNGNRKPFELSNTKKFLSRLESSQPAISAYSSAQGTIVTCGGVREIADTGNIILGATLGVGAIAVGGGGFDPGDMFDSMMLQTIYFESLFDKEANFIKGDTNPIAVDFFSGYMGENQQIENYYLASIGKSKILTYYNNKQKAVVLRKFEDAPSVEEMFRR